MANLDASLKDTIRDIVREEVADELDRYWKHGPESAPKPDWKVEAGAEVRVAGRDAGGGVIAVNHEFAWVLWWDNLGSLCPSTEKIENLTVTKPATPEAGDYVRTEIGNYGVIGKIRPGFVPRGYIIVGDGFEAFRGRDEFTIICKGAHHDTGD